ARRDVCRNLRGIGHAGVAGLCSILALSFIVSVAEGLVFDDRATHGSAKLIVIEWILGVRRKVEIITRRHFAAAELFQHGTMQRICATLGHDVDDGSALPAILGFVITENTQLSIGI